MRGLVKHIGLFGVTGTMILAARVLRQKLLILVSRPNKNGPFLSISHVARAFGIPFYRIPKVNSSDFHRIIDLHEPELLISLSCPQIIGQKIRDRIPKGCINVHGSPLPKYRGLMPAFWVLHNSEAKTAVTVHDLAAKLDDGDILIQTEVEISPEETWDSLVRKTKRAGAQVLVEAVHQIEQGTITRRPNVEERSTYYSFPTAAHRREFLAKGKRFF
jgi:methionyl-tRNA formyltransferase